MKLLIDAQLPRRLARELAAAGHDTQHTLELPLGNRTPDDEICALAIRESRVVVTKERDFVVSFWLRRMPPRLLLISTGNISNDALSRLVIANLAALENALAQHEFVGHRNVGRNQFGRWRTGVHALCHFSTGWAGLTG